MKKQRILLVFKAIIKYLMHYRPYMTVWVTVCVFYAIAGGIRKSSMATFVLLMLFAAVPAMIKRLILAISRIGGTNIYDEEAFGKGPRGRMKNYLIEYTKRNEKI